MVERERELVESLALADACGRVRACVRACASVDVSRRDELRTCGRACANVRQRD